MEIMYLKTLLLSHMCVSGMAHFRIVSIDVVLCLDISQALCINACVDSTIQFAAASKHST